MRKWLFNPNVKNILIILIGALINLGGRALAMNFSLPIWLDSVGTFLSAVLLGPFAGAISGALMNLIMGFFHPDQIVFIFVSIAGGLAVGFFFPRDRKIESFSVIATALFAGFVMTLVSTPLNLVLNNGYTGNVWGDALVDMTLRYVNSKMICCLLGGLFVNMPDKALSIVISLFIVYLTRIYRRHRPGAGVDGAMILIAAVTSSILIPSAADASEVSGGHDLNTDYYADIFDTDDGLISREINSVEQTSDGFIWVGAYSGLYKYNGSSFESVRIDDRINNCVYLYEDDASHLWIGTNDSGVGCYDIASHAIDFYTTQDGLPADSIRSICSDSYGRMYISTAEELARIDTDGSVHVYDSYPDITCIYSLDRLDDDEICGVTAAGDPVIISPGTIERDFLPDITDEGCSYTAVAGNGAGELLIGTSSNVVIHYARDDHGEWQMIRRIEVEGLNYVNCIRYSDRMGGYFVGGSIGMSFVDGSDRINPVEIDYFGHSINDVIVDYQENIWFASTKQGVMKLSYNPFSDVMKKSGVASTAVNALLVDGDRLYIGTDEGLRIINRKKNYILTDPTLSDRLDGVRIRHMMKDSSGNIWISTYGTEGLLCMTPENEVISYSQATDERVLGTRFRFTIELHDHTILAASMDGLNYIHDGEVITTTGIDDGLNVPQILSAVERPDGTVLAGSDGDGIYIIKNGVVATRLGAEQGLQSLVILRIIPARGGYLYVTSNGIYYDGHREDIRRLKNFPYSNNYDIWISDDDVAWISSSAGIYVVNLRDMLADSSYEYILLNDLRGFDTTLTANAHNAVSRDEMYLCCSDGVRKIDTDTFDTLNGDFNIMLSDVTDDDVQVPVEDGIYMIPSGEGRIFIQPAVLNFTLSNPLIRMELDGVEASRIYMHQADLQGMQYTSLPFGDYELRVEVVGELDGSVRKSATFKLHKDAELYEYTYFKVYLLFVSIMLIAFLAWTVAKMSNMAVIHRQYDQIREAKEEAEYANQAKSRFLANMSHEIRTPINAVLGMDEMILRESTEPDIRGYAADIYTAGNTLLSLINDILDSSKIESGKMEIVPVEYELSTLITDLVNMISQRAHDKDLQLCVEVDESLPSRLHGDDVRIRQVVTNILTNAVKYTPDGSVTMRVSGHRDDTGVILRFEVEDTGIGIKEEDLPKLFEAYQRIEEGRNRHIEGTGLGMSITLQLLALMDSRLEVESKYGEGSRFWFELHQDIVDEEPVGDIMSHAAAEGVAYKYEGSFIAPDAHVLVVDDNDMNRKVFKSLLKPIRLQISDASGGAQALDMARETLFDMVFMDHMMPDMDGVETMQLMRQIPGYDRIPIYVLTANAVTGAREQYMEAGFDGFISKPVVSERLEQALREELPEDLILPYEEAESGEKGSNSQTGLHNTTQSLPSDLPMIDGLDWNYAWMHLTDMDVLRSAVCDFAQVLSLHASKLNGMYDALDPADETSFDPYRIQVHSMKSTAATIGIVPLAGMAKILEFAARDKDIETIRNLHDIFIKEWLSYQGKLDVITGTTDDTGDVTDKPAADKYMLLAMLDMICEAMEDLDVDSADETMEKLRSYSYPPDIEAMIPDLGAAVSDLDSDECMRICDNIRNNMSF